MRTIPAANMPVNSFEGSPPNAEVVDTPRPPSNGSDGLVDEEKLQLESQILIAQTVTFSMVVMILILLFVFYNHQSHSSPY